MLPAMAPSPGSRSAAASKRRSPAGKSAPGAAREPRGARRKRETRGKLLRAAFELFGERGVDAVAINEITEAADVGFGSFYNHFESKEAIYAAVVDAVFGEFADRLDDATAAIEDPAEIISICIRQTIARAHAEPPWGRFFLREGLNPTALERGLGSRLWRDIRRAIASGRIAPPDPTMAWLLAGGGVLATAATEAALTKHGTAVAKQAGLDTKNLASRAAAVILQVLGLRRTEAAKLAAKPLPPLKTKPLFG